MTLIEIAKIYTELVELERQVPEEEYRAKDMLNSMRTKYHEQLMAKMREDGMIFSDRFDAANKAFELISQNS